MLQSAEDFLVDNPKLWEYLAEMVEPLFEDGAMNLGFLGPLSTTLGSSLAPPFVASVLKELVIAQVSDNLFVKIYGIFVFLGHSSFPPRCI